MDAAREGHADIASMLREAGASDATLAAEAAPVHKVQCHITARWLQPKALAPSCPQCDNSLCRALCLSGLPGRTTAAWTPRRSCATGAGLKKKTKTLLESESQWPRERLFTFYIIVSQKYFIPSVLRYVFAQHYISVNRSGPAPTH